MDTTPIEKSTLRNISKVLSSTWVNSLVDTSKKAVAKKQLKSLLKESRINLSSNTIGEALDNIYTHLLYNYRNEYVYKNELLKKFISEHHYLEDTIVFNEFQIGKSKADVVTINGKNTVFEIKTELDSPLRLKTQISDYYKAFDQVYIVTHHSLVDKYLSITDNTSIGILVLNSDCSYQTIKEAELKTDSLCIETMMKCLRKYEFIEINKSLFSELPIVNDFQLFDALLEQAKLISPFIYQRHFLSILKKRTLTESDLFNSPNTPQILKYICYNLDLTKKQYIRLNKSLNSRL